jgi:hypothetical protein
VTFGFLWISRDRACECAVKVVAGSGSSGIGRALYRANLR